jgi:uncharacterized protein involved in type VI secretion and phage assembly
MFDPTQGGEAVNEAKRYYGKYPAIVVKPDNDSDPNIGRVKVQIPAFLEAAPGSAAGADQPIEVVALPCFSPGFFFVPEEGDNVWVEFAAGDIDFPVWTGVWYPKDKFPRTVDGKQPTAKQKVIRTKGGHVIQIDDTSNAEKIVIQHGTDGKGRITLDSNGITLDFGNGKTVLEMKSDGTTLKSAAGSGPIALGAAIDALTDVLNSHAHPFKGPAGTTDPIVTQLPSSPAWKSK